MYDVKCPDEILGGSISYNSASAIHSRHEMLLGDAYAATSVCQGVGKHFVFNGHAPLSVSRGQTFPDNAFPDNFQWYFW